MITENATMFYRSDGGIVCTWDGKLYSVTKDSNPENWEAIQSYLLLHPEALIPEPVPPEPTAEELAARRVAEIKAQIAELDRQSIRPIRAKEQDRLDEIEAQVVALRAELKALE